MTKMTLEVRFITNSLEIVKFVIVLKSTLGDLRGLAVQKMPLTDPDSGFRKAEETGALGHSRRFFF